MKYIKTFDTHSEYQAYSSSSEFITPNVSFCKDNTDEVHYSPYVKPYDQQYLTFEALESSTFTFTMTEKLTTQCISSISYSLDDGKTWTTTNNVDNESVTVTTPTVTSGNKVLWKASAVQFCTNTDSYPGGNIGYGSFTSTGNYNVSGNIMSLLYGDNFSNQTTLPTPITSGYSAGAFGYLFGRSNTKLVSAENLILPATTLTTYCYTNMFYGCTSLTTAPELPATTLAQGCYQYMFRNCTFLTTAPELPATTLANNCYNNMFAGCTGLTSVPSNYLPATTLAQSCYSYMFQGCTSLTTAPELPSTTLVKSCYYQMFNGCSNLNYIKAMFTTTPSDSYTSNWVNGVAATGTFVKNSAAQWDVTGANGIPNGWTVQTASE